MKLTIYAARCRGNEFVKQFPDAHVIDMDEENLEIIADQAAQAVTMDNTPANFGDKGRSNENFICADACSLDFDNADPDPANHVNLNEIVEAFTLENGERVAMIFERSRNYMRESHGNIAERWHAWFAMNLTTDGEHLRKLRQACKELLPAVTLDAQSADPSRLFFGVVNPHIDVFPGSLTLDEFFQKKGIVVDAEPASENENQGIEFNRSTGSGSGEVYLEGTRNNTVHQKWLQWLTRHGDQGETANKKAFEEIASRCKPELPQKDLNVLYNGGLKRFHEVIEKDPNYIPPESYSAMLAAEDMKQADQDAGSIQADQVEAPEITEEIISRIGELLAPDPSDVGQGNGWLELFGDQFRNFNGIWLHDTGQVLKEDKAAAVKTEIKHTSMQLDVCRKQIFQATQKLNEAREAEDKEATEAAAAELKKANGNFSWAIGRRKYGSIDAALKAAGPFRKVEADQLDSNPELLNTPAGVVDLRTGNILPYSPQYLMTKITAVAPSDQGADIWENFLNEVMEGNTEKIDYFQKIAGSFLYGDVLSQKLIIVYSPIGGTAKSTTLNAIQYIMGDYASGLAADILTTNTRLNKRAELAELRGLRLAICAELSEGTRLDSSMLKQLCSNDLVRAERKYCDPFSFKPSHSVVLYSNYLPRVSAADSATWDRIIVLPFTHRFRGEAGEKTNYCKYLCDKAGGAILSWMIRGCVEFLNEGGIITPPEEVKQATRDYQDENDIIAQFIDERCEQIADYAEASSVLYGGFQDYCKHIGTRAKNIHDFRRELESKGFEHHKTKSNNEFFGLRLKPWDFNDFDE